MAQYPYTSIRFRYTGGLATFGFIFFYFIWKYTFPQPYENAPIRIVGFIFSFGFLVQDYFPARFKKWMPLYTYIYSILAAPAFFTFMLIMNQGSVAWQMSLMCAIIYLILLFDSLNTIIIFSIGTLIGILSGASFYTLRDIYSFYSPVSLTIAFALASGAILNYADEYIRNQKRLAAAFAVGANIAHEMRTPFLGIAFSAEGISKVLPRLVQGYVWAIHNGWDGDGQRIVPSTQLEGTVEATRRVQRLTAHANKMIDILLMNVSEPRIEKTKFTSFSMRSVITEALVTYPFKTGEKELITFSSEEDFNFYGSDLLMTHVIYNLIKNSLRAVAEVQNGTIAIHLKATAEGNMVIFEDTGHGIPSRELPYIFERFYSGTPNGLGVGIGLHFCRRVIESMGGTITCTSVVNSFTRFMITLPTQTAKA